MPKQDMEKQFDIAFDHVWLGHAALDMQVPATPHKGIKNDIRLVLLSLIKEEREKTLKIITAHFRKYGWEGSHYFIKELKTKLSSDK